MASGGESDGFVRVSVNVRVCVRARAGNINIRVCVSEGGVEGGSRLSVTMRRGREGEEERMMGDKKENLDPFHACLWE